MPKSDKDVLYEFYRDYPKSIGPVPKKVDEKYDKAQLESMPGNIAKALVYLEEMNLPLSMLQKHVKSAKGIYVVYVSLYKRHPDMLNDFLTKKIDQLIQAIAKVEADMINNIRLQEAGGDRLNLEEIIFNPKIQKRLSSQLASVVIRDVLKDYNTYVGDKESKVLYITPTGKKYHFKDCPYCKGKALQSSSEKIIKNLGLTPCKCVLEEEERIKKAGSSCTIFVDESIHQVLWNANGDKGKVGSYSYIICKGYLKDESEITKDNVIATGFEYCPEKQHTYRVTQSAIGATMLILAYDHNFSGDVKIFTDNKKAMQSWKNDPKNIKVAGLFKSVTVQFVPRELNTQADKVGRTHYCLKMPAKTYSEVVKKLDMYANFESENARLKKCLLETEDSTKILKEELTAKNDRIANLKAENSVLSTRQSILKILRDKIKDWLAGIDLQLAFDK